MYECRHKLIEETLLLTKERIGITHGATQDTTDHVTGLRIRRQLTVGNREAHGTEMIGTDAHSDVDCLLCLVHLTFLEGRIFQSCDLLLRLDDRLEDIRIIVRVLPLQHTHQALEAHTRINHIHRKFLE